MENLNTMFVKYLRTPFILLILILIFISCSENKRVEKNFKNYVLNQFNLTIEGENTIFFIVPSYSCPGCELKLRKIFHGFCPSDAQLYIISTNDSKDRIPVNHCSINLIDKSNLIDRLDIGTRASTIAYFKKGKLIEILEFTDPNMMKIEKIINSFD